MTKDFKFLEIDEIIFLLVQGRVRIIDVLVAGTGLLEETARALRSRVLRRSNSASFFHISSLSLSFLFSL